MIRARTRYKETVSPALVRDFRGSMQGRAEKGLILTTGRFTQEAQKEAKGWRPAHG